MGYRIRFLYQNHMQIINLQYFLQGFTISNYLRGTTMYKEHRS